MWTALSSAALAPSVRLIAGGIYPVLPRRRAQSQSVDYPFPSATGKKPLTVAQVTHIVSFGIPKRDPKECPSWDLFAAPWRRFPGLPGPRYGRRLMWPGPRTRDFPLPAIFPV